MALRGRLLVLLIAAGAILGLWLLISHLSLSALDEPGSVETYAATKAKRWMVGRSARGLLSPAPPEAAVSLASGRMFFGGRCASCHGLDGRTPTDVGQWMYPRAPDVGSP